MLDGADASKAFVSHARELGQKVLVICVYGLFLAGDVDILSLLFWVCVGFSRAFFVRTVKFSGSLLLFLRSGGIKLKNIDNEDPLQDF